MTKPDWKKADDYAYLKKLETGPQWAWEFLRRNQEYRKSYFKHESQLTEYMYDPPKPDGTSDTKWVMHLIAHGYEPRKQLVGTIIARRWGLKGTPIHPDINALELTAGDQPVQFEMPRPIIYRAWHQTEDIPLEHQIVELANSSGTDEVNFIAKHKVLVLLDVRDSWQSQSKAVQVWFAESKKNFGIGQPKITAFEMAVRILDAFLAGVDKAEILHNLYPNPTADNNYHSAFEAHRKAALRNSELGYLAIALKSKLGTK